MIIGIGALIEGHDDVRTEVFLDANGTFGREVMRRTVDVTLEGHAFVINLAGLRQRKNLITARVGQQGARPAHKAMQAAKLGDQIVAGTQVKMIGVTQYQRGIYILEMFGRKSLDSGLRANRREDRRNNIAVTRVENTHPGAVVFGCNLEFKHQVDCKRELGDFALQDCISKSSSHEFIIKFCKEPTMFSINDRNRIRDRVLQLADSDSRVVAGAVVGSLAHSDGDRWSDLDLTFAVADEFSMYDVLEEWTRTLVEEFDAAHLFDLPSGPSIYRVFLLPGCLQFDLSFTPASKFGANSPKFKLLFGNAVERPYTQPPPAQELFGYAVHHALRARFCIERGRYWQAEYWISGVRDYALHLACRRRGLPASNGRDFDELPSGVQDAFKCALVTSLERDELLRALGCVIEGLLSEVDEVRELAAKVEPQLRELTKAWDDENSNE